MFLFASRCHKFGEESVNSFAARLTFILVRIQAVRRVSAKDLIEPRIPERKSPFKQ